MLRRIAVAAVVMGCALVPAAPALASGNDVIKDCVRNGRLTKQYSQREYRSALSNLPTDVDEYTDCREIIRRAQLGLTGSGGTGPGAGGGAPGAAPDAFAGATPQEVVAAKHAIAVARGHASPRRLGAGVVTPGALAYRNLGAISKLPTPLLVLAVLILAAALATAAYLLVTRVRAGRRSA